MYESGGNDSQPTQPTMPIFPKVGEPITVGFIRNYNRIKKGEQNRFEFLYNGGWLHVETCSTDFYGRATHLKITGRDNEHYTVCAKRSLSRSGSSNLWHDLKKLADPEYDHPFDTGMGDADVEHPFHNPGPEPMKIA